MSKQLILILFICFSAVIGLNAQNANAYPDIPYQGKRVFIQKLKLGKSNKNGQSFQAVLINTGKSLVTNKDFQEKTVLIKTNPSVIEILNTFQIEDLYQALASKSLKLEAGVTQNKYSAWLVQGSSHVVLKEPKIEAAEKKEIPQPDVNIPDEVTEKEAATSEKESIVEKKPKALNKEEKPEPLADDQSTLDSKIDLPEAEEAKDEILEEKSEVTTTTDIDPEEDTSLEEGCADIRIEKLVVVKKTKGSVTLSYTLINEGNGPALLKGRTKNEDNLALRAHLCSSDKLTRGAITLGGIFIKVNDDSAYLKSGESYSGELKLPLYKLTKFTPYIVVQADPYQKIIECDETNNINFVNLMPKEMASDPN